MCKMNKWQHLPRDLWFLKWKALGASSPLADFGRLRQSSDVFGRLRTSSGIFGNDRVVFKNPGTPRIKISRLYLGKSWQVYINHTPTLHYRRDPGQCQHYVVINVCICTLHVYSTNCPILMLRLKLQKNQSKCCGWSLVTQCKLVFNNNGIH